MRENGEEAFARLVKAVEESQEVIRGHSLAVDSSEARTRMALIDPVLSALGWRTSNPAEVLAEYAVDAGRADYALLRSGTRKTEVLAFVEAKKLGEPLASHREQALRYATTAGVQFAALTNGDSWELYGLGGGAPRRMLNISLRARSARSCATQLLALRRERPRKQPPSSSRTRRSHPQIRRCCGVRARSLPAAGPVDLGGRPPAFPAHAPGGARRHERHLLPYTQARAVEKKKRQEAQGGNRLPKETQVTSAAAVCSRRMRRMRRSTWTSD